MRDRLYYGVYPGFGVGGLASRMRGAGQDGHQGILLHEFGHMLSLPHWATNENYPYKGSIKGLEPATSSGDHVGLTWAYDLPTKTFIPPIVQENAANGKNVGKLKPDPMQGGGTGSQEKGFLYNHFSDYSAKKIRDYLDSRLVIWDEGQSKYVSWDSSTGTYTKTIDNNGVDQPIERDVDVYSVLVCVSGGSKETNIVYPPIGPYKSGLIRLLDPRSEEDREFADAHFSPSWGSDASLRITQGGIEKVCMLDVYRIIFDPEDNDRDPLHAAVNLPVSDGPITKVELLATPNAEKNGLPENPEVLAVWTAFTPEVATFEVAPQPLSSSAIAMTAEVGKRLTIAEGAIEYKFTEISGNPGGSSSAWQASPRFINTGLTADTTYQYRVSMRSGSLRSVDSVAISATTPPALPNSEITVDDSQEFSLESGSKLQRAIAEGDFSAAGADKLVVAVFTENSSNNGQGAVIEVRYNDQKLTEAIQEDGGPERGATAIYYLDNPGPAETESIKVRTVTSNGGTLTAYALSGTAPGFGQTAKTSGSSATSLDLETIGNASIVIAALQNAGKPNDAGTSQPIAPLVPGSSGKWGRGWASSASGYQFTSGPTQTTSSFTTPTGKGYAINIAAAEFFAASVPVDYNVWTQKHPAASLGNPNFDFDQDGLSNEYERLFGLDPADPSSVSHLVGPIKQDGSFTYRRRDDALTGKTYTVWTSETMEDGSWVEQPSAIQQVTPINGADVETVKVTLDPSLFTRPELFIRINVE